MVDSKKPGRQKNLIRTKPIPVSTTSLNMRYLEQIVMKGQKGKTIPEAAERIISDYIEQLIRAGTLKEIQFGPEDMPIGNDASATEEVE